MADKRKLETKVIKGVKYIRFDGDEDWQTKKETD